VELYDLGRIRPQVEQACARESSFQSDCHSFTYDKAHSRLSLQTFLLRHVYASTITTYRLSRISATFLTFLLSALCHELVMAVVSKKIR
jgi:hypothetical protein